MLTEYYLPDWSSGSSDNGCDVHFLFEDLIASFLLGPDGRISYYLLVLAYYLAYWEGHFELISAEFQDLKYSHLMSIPPLSSIVVRLVKSRRGAGCITNY